MNWVRSAFQCDGISVDCRFGYVTPGKGEVVAGERRAPSGAARSTAGSPACPERGQGTDVRLLTWRASFPNPALACPGYSQ